MELVVNPPQPGDASYGVYAEEKQSILGSLARKAKMLQKALNECQGVTCTDAQGALYLFPRLSLPRRFVEECEADQTKPDEVYCQRMLLKTGVCVIPGSGFGQQEGTYHYRIAFLPAEDQITEVAEKIKSFHRDFMALYE